MRATARVNQTAEERSPAAPSMGYADRGKALVA